MIPNFYERERVLDFIKKIILEEETDETEKPNMARRDTAACLAFPSNLDPSPRHSLLKIKIEAIEDEEEDEEEDKEKDEEKKNPEKGIQKTGDGDTKLEQENKDNQEDDGVVNKKNVETNIRYICRCSKFLL